MQLNHYRRKRCLKPPSFAICLFNSDFNGYSNFMDVFFLYNHCSLIIILFEKTFMRRPSNFPYLVRVLSRVWIGYRVRVQGSCFVAAPLTCSVLVLTIESQISCPPPKCGNPVGGLVFGPKKRPRVQCTTGADEITITAIYWVCRQRRDCYCDKFQGNLKSRFISWSLSVDNN